jgi:hypothetical protein
MKDMTTTRDIEKMTIDIKRDHIIVQHCYLYSLHSSNYYFKLLIRCLVLCQAVVLSKTLDFR